VYTAPPSPANGVFGTCSGVPGNCVTIVATATSTNFVAANPEQVTIRLVPTGVVLPPAGSPVASFSASPTPAQMNVPVTFDASASTPGTGASQITSYSWSFGDGSSGTGRSVNHTFTSQQNFNVTLTVTNDRGLTNSTTNAVSVGSVAAPSPTFVFSPGAPQIGQAIVFNADQSTAAPGHALTVFGWNFGDGATANGSITTHAYTAAGTYNVVLSVADDTGQKSTKSSTVTVTSGGGSGGSATVAAFVASPTAPVVGQVVFFNASSSSAATGHALTKYAWDFGDGTSFTGTAATTNHTFTNAGAFVVSLAVTDDTGQLAKTSNTVTVAAAGAAAPTAHFTTSPSTPGVNQSVFFNASTSAAGTGHTIAIYAWDFGDGGTGTGVTPTHAYNRAGSFTVNLVVTDEAGQTGSTSAAVSVTAASSQIVADFTFSPTDPKITGGTNTVFFDATPSSSSNAITSYVWDFGDGTSGATQKPSHLYTLSATYVVRLTVTDSAGGTATITKTVSVGP
jgi:PKD repeat protein